MMEVVEISSDEEDTAVAAPSGQRGTGRQQQQRQRLPGELGPRREEDEEATSDHVVDMMVASSDDDEMHTFATFTGGHSMQALFEELNIEVVSPASSEDEEGNMSEGGMDRDTARVMGLVPGSPPSLPGADKPLPLTTSALDTEHGARRFAPLEKTLGEIVQELLSALGEERPTDPDEWRALLYSSQVQDILAAHEGMVAARVEESVAATRRAELKAQHHELMEEQLQMHARRLLSHGLGRDINTTEQLYEAIAQYVKLSTGSFPS